MKPKNMHQLLKNKYALSTVVTTLIILVISVLLASVVTYFAINVVSTRVQEESLHLTKQHVWYDAETGETQAAIMIINSGGRDVVIDKICVRGQESDWSTVFTATTSASVGSDLPFVVGLVADAEVDVGLDDPLTLTATTSDPVLRSGYTMILYITSPDSITINDVGLTVAFTVFTSQAMYYKETNVQANV